MSIALDIALYLMIWWIVLFAVLPWGMRTQDEDGEVVLGTPGSAPTKPRLVRIFLINTVVAGIIFALVWGVISSRMLELSSLPDPSQTTGPQR